MFGRIVIYRVVDLPDFENILWTYTGHHIRVGDYAWDVDLFQTSPLVHLTGYDKEWKAIWYANFKKEQVTYIGERPDHLSFEAPNPFPTIE